MAVERFTRKRGFTVLLAAILLLSVLIFLTNFVPNRSSQSKLSIKEDSHHVPLSDTAIQKSEQNDVAGKEEEEEGEEEDRVQVSTKPKDMKEWKPKPWGRLSDEIEQAIQNNIRLHLHVPNKKSKNQKTTEERILLTAVANQGMAEYTLNWITSLKKCGLDDKFLVFAIDEALVSTLAEHGYKDHVVLIPNEWFHKELSSTFEAWLSNGYTPITHAKSLVVERLLYTDVTVWFSDVDIVFTSPSIYDYLVMKLTARKQTEVLFTQETEQRLINSGFYVMRPTMSNKRLLDASIYIQDTEQDKKPEVTQQRAMNRVIETMDLNYQTSSIVLLDLMLFPHGRAYFDQNMPSKYGLQPMMVHANYRKGENKMKDLKRFGLWYI